MTRVFNLSELMVVGFGVSDPVTGGGETREGSASDSYPLLNGENRLKVSVLQNERHQLSIPTAFPSGCGDCARGFILLSVLFPPLHLTWQVS